MPEWNAAGFRRGRSGQMVLAVLHLPFTSSYVEGLFDAGLNRAYAQAIWKCFRANWTGLVCVPSLEDQRVFLRVAEALPVGAGLKDEVDGEDNWDFEGTLSVE